MYKPHYTYEEIKAYDFKAAWKVDDKDWIKKRRYVGEDAGKSHVPLLPNVH